MPRAVGGAAALPAAGAGRRMGRRARQSRQMREEAVMLQAMTQNWWAWLIRGILAIIFGVIAFFQPTAAGFALVLVFGVYAILDGILNIWAALSGSTEHRVWYVVWGIISIIAGIIVFINPILAAWTLVTIIGIWAIITGILEIIAAIRLRDEIQGEFWLILSGILSVIFGILITFRPLAGALAIVYLIGIYAVLFGIALVAFSFRLKSLGERMPPAAV
jgi:uncharacterized membrane protein HdeD (DUF308 family)